ncbi:hypothetical protein BN946_scf184868.g29 [Trametes cinnabarina]|uniref:Uncharacterized protein n=1 Tax=Pycnoporus cinnabarinus TaxID=5643 RepID=A0A060SQF7_PYCCI|nr:hypothetical protein BN946_scf184868.g29 [Trametes cinnabarina]
MSESGLSAAALLDEIHSESLQTFLSSVRAGTSPPGLTQIPALDIYLASAVNSRPTARKWPLNKGDVLEVQGPAASGKTHFIYHMLVACLLPETRLDMELGGWGKAAILFDADGKFSIHRLHELLVSRLKSFLGDDDSMDNGVSTEDLATECLQHLHVFRPTSSAQLAITLLNLPHYHATDSRLQRKEIGVLAIDSMSAFYWRDRYTLEQLRDAADSQTRTNLPPSPLLHVLKGLANFRTSHRPVILMTNWGLNPIARASGSGESGLPFYRQHLHPFPAPFEPHGAADALFSLEASQRTEENATLRDGGHSRLSHSILPLHHHITLHPYPIDPFPASFSLTDALRHENMRAFLVKKGEIRGSVRTPGPPEALTGEFTFRIGERAVLVDPDEEPGS